jgi:hypothetical protein
MLGGMRVPVDVPDEIVTGLRRLMLHIDPKSSVREQAARILIREVPNELVRLGLVESEVEPLTEVA